MPQLSLEHLRDLQPGDDRARLVRESLQRIAVCGLPEYERGLFFPEARATAAEEHLMKITPAFSEACSVHLLMQRLAQDPHVGADERKRINTTKAELFLPACAQREPPQASQPDPVVQYGWDRTRDKMTIMTMQNQCAWLFLSCDRIAFVEATPAIAPYCSDGPKKWYADLARYITSPFYARTFAVKMKAGTQIVRDLLSNLFTKLVVLHDAAKDPEMQPYPPAVISDLCTQVGLPTMDGLGLDGHAADEIRNLFETIAGLAKKDSSFALQLTLYGLMRPATRVDLIGAFDSDSFTVKFLDFVFEVSPWIPGMQFLPWLRDKMVAAEIAKRVQGVGERSGRKYGLWS